MGVKPIADPVADAEAKWKKPFLIQRRTNLWRREAAHCTTAQFEKLDGGYIRHCGPTAITNVILTLNRKYHMLRKSGTTADDQKKQRIYYFPAPQVVFRQVSRIGIQRHFYWNVNVWKRFGGTYDLLLKRYLKACFADFGFRAEMSGKYPVSDTDFLESLRKGKLLYLQLYRHPLYGNHHLICYGMVETASADSRIHKNYLIVADGWSRQDRYIDTDDLIMCHYMEIDLCR